MTASEVVGCNAVARGVAALGGQWAVKGIMKRENRASGRGWKMEEPGGGRDRRDTIGVFE